MTMKKLGWLALLLLPAVIVAVNTWLTN